jgi:hypothetical protein
MGGFECVIATASLHSWFVPMGLLYMFSHQYHFALDRIFIHTSFLVWSILERKKKENKENKGYEINRTKIHQHKPPYSE